MAWNPLTKLKETFGKTSRSEGQGAPPAKAASTAQVAEALKDAPPADLKELEKKGMLGQFFRHWKNPAFLKQLKTLAGRMQADGVNVKDSAAVKKWVEEHKKEIEAGRFEAPQEAAALPTFHKEGPGVGRNDPCSCGSGKKYKKCCGR